MTDGIAVAPSEREALDAYSQIVSTVAERVLPSVASLRVRRAGSPRDGGAGSGVVITPDGYLVTSAHVVAQAGKASASFIDGTEYELDLAMERWHRERQEIDTPLEAEFEIRQRVIDLRRQAG